MRKNRKQKQIDYANNYYGIPLDYKDRLEYMIDKFNVTENKMEEILNKKFAIERNLQYYDLNMLQNIKY